MLKISKTRLKINLFGWKSYCGEYFEV